MVNVLLVGAVAIVIALWWWGRGLPATQQWSRDVLIEAPREQVWAVMTDYLRQVEWRTDLRSVAMAASPPGKECWMERPRRGHPSACRVARQRPGHWLEIERRLNGTGRVHWSARLEQAAEATRLTLTETLEISNPFARLVQLAWNRTAINLESYERDLKQRVERLPPVTAPGKARAGRARPAAKRNPPAQQ